MRLFTLSDDLRRITLTVSAVVLTGVVSPRPAAAQDTDEATATSCETCADTTLKAGEELTVYTAMGASYSGQYLCVSPIEHLLVISAVVDSRPGQLKVPFDQLDRITYRRVKQPSRTQLGIGILGGAMVGYGISLSITTNHERLLGHQDPQQAIEMGALGAAASALIIHVISLFPVTHTLQCRPPKPIAPSDESL